MSKIRCKIKMYDPAVTEPPLQFIELDEFECLEPLVDGTGTEFATVFRRECLKKGYSMKFWSLASEKGYDYDVCVYDPEEKPWWV